MTTFEKIVEALKPFGLPYSPDLYNGSARSWFTYNYADDYGTNFADDEPGAIIVDVQVHLFLSSCEDFICLKNKVRRALFKAGFTFPEITVLTEDDDTRHIVFECEIEENE